MGEKNPDQTPSRRYSGKQSQLRMNFIRGIARRCGGRLIPQTQCGREATAIRRGRNAQRFLYTHEGVEEPGEAQGRFDV